VHTSHRFPADRRANGSIKISTRDITMPPGWSDVSQVDAEIACAFANERLRADGSSRDRLRHVTWCLSASSDGLVVDAITDQHGFTDFHGDDRGTNVNQITWFSMNPLHGPSEWAGEFDGGLRSLDLDDHLVHLNGVTRLDEPSQDLGLGQALTYIGESEYLVRH
jgi:hypothetical protein